MKLIIYENELKDGELPINKIVCGHVLRVLKKLPSNSVDCIITSPPYWGLRFYGEQANTVWGGDPNCEHEWEFEEDEVGRNDADRMYSTENGIKKTRIKQGFCKKCGAWYGQLGLEPTLDMFIDHLLEITAELKRVLKPSGCMFWNHGDCYSGNMGKRSGWSYVSNLGNKKDGTAINFKPKYDFPQKCLCLQNYILALRMIQEQGWILRNIIIWYKPNHMPESVKDRFTKSYEPVFFFVKSKKYLFDLDAVREPHKESTLIRASQKNTVALTSKAKPDDLNVNQYLTIDRSKISKLGKNPRDVWEIPTQPFSAKQLGFEDVDHFAVFPPKLVERMVKCGCPLDGLVLDPFLGSGTAGMVARMLGRNFIGIEINPDYCKIAEARIKQHLEQKKLWEVLKDD